MFDCLVNSFKYFKGIPKEILFDNMSTVVDRKVSTFKTITLSDKFKHFSKEIEAFIEKNLKFIRYFFRAIIIGGHKVINYNKVLSNLEELKLDKIRTYLPNYLNSIKDKDISIADILYELTEKEVKFKNQRASRIQVVVSEFPFEKEVRDFDFLYQPSVSKSQILDLESLRFLENKENIVFVGTSGVGKIHLAVALGMAVAKKRYSVYFILCHESKKSLQ